MTKPISFAYKAAAFSTYTTESEWKQERNARHPHPSCDAERIPKLDITAKPRTVSAHDNLR